MTRTEVVSSTPEETSTLQPVSLPAGTVTFLFTDIEGSTRLLHRLGEDYGRLVSQHRRVMRETATEAGGSEIDVQGDAFFFGFTRARDAAAGAIATQRRLAAEEWPDGAEVKVRMGVHTGEPTLGEEGYLGLDVVRGARIAAAAHGGQILLSETTRALLPTQLPDGAAIVDLGEHSLKDLERPEHLYQLVAPGLGSEFPALRIAEPVVGFENRLERRINTFVENKLAGLMDGMEVRELESGGLLLRRRGRDDKKR
jgi:class 3 adenylate cyclase